MARGTLILLRHGQTTYNEKQLMCGQHDAPLTALGEEQAKEAGRALAGIRFDKIYSSSLSRAFNTASLALQGTGDTPAVERRDDLMECDAGDFTGRSLSDPEILAFPRDRHMALPNGESEREFVGRVRKFYEDEILPRMARGETVLVVSHAGVMHALDVVMTAAEPASEKSIWDTKKRLPNTAIIVAEYDGGKLASQYMPGDKFPPAPPKPDAFNPAL